MIRRALHGEIERELEAVFQAGRHQRAEVLDGAELGMQCIVPTLGRADRVGRAGLALGCDGGIVAALAAGAADRVDRREIQHVKTHRGDVGHARDAVAQRAVLAGDRALAARHHLIPGPEARVVAVDDQREVRRARQVGARLALGHGVAQLSRQQRRNITAAEIILALPDDHGRGVLPRAVRLGQQARALDGIERDVAAAQLLAFDAVTPGGEFVGPGFDGIDILAGLDGCERAGPAVIAMMGHGLAPPVALLLAAPDQRGADPGVAVAVDVGPHLDPVARDPLHGKAAAIDQRIDIFDEESAA